MMNTHYSRERGAALLFAMGLLSLFLILAMAFAANSLMQRKIAANRGVRAMNDVLAKSALNRVLLALSLYQTDKMPVSADDRWDVNALSTRGAKLAGSTDPENDGLKDLLTISKYKHGGDQVTLYDDEFYTLLPANRNGNAWKLPDWRFVIDEKHDNRIVGRYAYLMVPSFPRDFVPNTEFESYKEYFASQANDVDKTDDKQLNALRDWEIFTPPQPEAYVARQKVDTAKKPDTEEWFQRFDLNRNNWDEITVNDLLGKPESFFEFDGKGDLQRNADGTPKLNKTKTKTIQFLNRIGDEKGTFLSIKDRRRQIAANLIDYNDTNLIPTSDVAPSDWMTSKPAYTGNENTLYLDRLAFALDFNAKFTALSGDLANGFKVNAAFLPKVAVMGGVVKIYKDTPVDGYKMYLLSNRMSIDALVSLHISYVYEKNVGTADVPKYEPAGGHVTLASDKYKWEDNQAPKATVNFSENFVGPKGYTVATGSWSPIPEQYISKLITVKELEIWDAELAANIAADKIRDGSFAIIAAGMDLEVENIGIDIQRLVLSRGDGNVDVTHEFDLSYTPATPIAGALVRNDKSIGFPIGVGGIWAKDPRQNLHVNLTDDDKSDWNVFTKKNESFAGTVLTLAMRNWSATDLEKEGSTMRNKIFPQFNNLIAAKGLDSALFSGMQVEASEYDLPSRNPLNGLDKELSTVTSPGWRDGLPGEHLSTAFFRNDKMRSLSELGFIHRGAKWETLVLHNATRPSDLTLPVDARDYVFEDWSIDNEEDGSSYEGGDGGILDQVKVGVYDVAKGEYVTKNYREDIYNLNLRDGYWDKTDSKFVIPNERRGFFYFENLYSQFTIGAFEQDLDNPNWSVRTSGETMSKTTMNSFRTRMIHFLDCRYDKDINGTPRIYQSRAQLLFFKPADDRGYFNGYGDWTTDIPNTWKNKAFFNEFSGKTMEWTYALPIAMPDVYRVVIVAQSIQDVGGKDDPFTMSRDLNFDGEIAGEEADKEVWLGRYEKGFDDIVGQSRMLVTIVRDPILGTFTVKNIDYIEE